MEVLQETLSMYPNVISRLQDQKNDLEKFMVIK